MPEGVKCSVSNCYFWAQGNKCDANSILIEIDKHARASLNEEFAGENLGAGHKDAAPDSKATCCHTFKPKEA